LPGLGRWLIPGQCPAAFAGHGEISVAKDARWRARVSPYRCANHIVGAERLMIFAGGSITKISARFDPFNFRKIRVDFTQKPRFIANVGFKPVC
jgi:hypothetical protein